MASFMYAKKYVKTNIVATLCVFIYIYLWVGCFSLLLFLFKIVI